MMVLAGNFLLRKNAYHDNKREMTENPLVSAIIALNLVRVTVFARQCLLF